MASLSEIVTVNISLLTASLNVQGFGIPMIFDYHTNYSDRIRFYTKLADVATDGFATTSSGYKAAAAMFAQSPRPAQIAIGRRITAPTMSVVLTPVAANSTVYTVYLNGTAASYTSDGTATVAEITAGLKTAIDALAVSGVSTVDGGTILTVSATAGIWFSLEARDSVLLGIQNNTTAANLGTELDSLLLIDSSWYGLTLTGEGIAEVNAAAVWAAANEKLAILQSQDSNNITATYNLSGTDEANILSAATNLRTALIFHERAGEFAASAWMSLTFAYNPGAVNFANKQLASVSKSLLSQTHINNLKAKHANFYVDFAGLGATRNGQVSGNEWIDFIRDRDALKADMQAGVARVVLVNPKVPMTDAGISLVDAAVRASLSRFVANGFLVDGSVVVTTPKASEVSLANRAARTLSLVQWTAQAQGGINIVTISGSVTV